MPGIGADCSEDDECAADNTACLERSNSTSIKDSDQTRSCQCRKGYVHFKDECLKEGMYRTKQFSVMEIKGSICLYS